VFQDVRQPCADPGQPEHAGLADARAVSGRSASAFPGGTPTECLALFISADIHWPIYTE
jgi:hypothetical protein